MNKEYKTNYAKQHGLDFQDYNGWCNRDTWLVMLWLENDQTNYENMGRIVKNTHDLADLTDLMLYGELKDFYYGDKINFKNVDIDEVRTVLVELHGTNEG